uniref:Uncharacterized protein n=1 Tax=Romanomermis culicivorax TaxID=13658 RepID=A0A915JCQ0_ROMCU
MASKHAPFDTDAEDQDDAEDLEWDQDAANALGKFVESSRQPGRKMCNILWKGDDTAMQRPSNFLSLSIIVYLEH